MHVYLEDLISKGIESAYAEVTRGFVYFVVRSPLSLAPTGLQRQYPILHRVVESS
jgi:hypothetical protein